MLTYVTFVYIYIHSDILLFWAPMVLGSLFAYRSHNLPVCFTLVSMVAMDRISASAARIESNLDERQAETEEVVHPKVSGSGI